MTAIVMLNLGVFLLISTIDILPPEAAPINNLNIFSFYALSFDADTLTMFLIFSSIVAMAALLKDESKNTTEFLFAHPISRKKMYITQLLSFFVNIIDV